MKRKILALCLACAMTVGTLTGCGSGNSADSAADSTAEGSASGSDATVFNMPITVFPETLNPTDNVDADMAVNQALYECLYATDANGETYYYLAESCEAGEDGLSLTVKLRDNATWSDGEDITADDVLFTVDYYQNCVSDAVASLTGGGYTCEKTDDKTVTVTLDAPMSSFENDFGSIRLLPAHVFDNDTDKVEGSEYLTDADKIVTSGAYTVAEINSGESFVLKARDDYYGGTPGFETLNLVLKTDSNAQQLAFDSGELSCFAISSADDYEKYNTDDYNLTSYSSGRVVHLQYNPDGQSGEGLSDDAKQAIANAIDRDELVATVYGSDELGMAADSMFASTQTYYDDSLTHETDLEAAKELAESSGLTEKTVNIIYNTTYANGESIAVVLQQQLANAGITAEVQGYDPSAFYTRVFHAMMGESDSAEATDWDYAVGFDSGMYGDASANQLTYAYMGLLGEKTSGLVIQAYSTADESEKEALFKEAQQTADEEGYWIPLTEETKVVVSQKNITGFEKNMKDPMFINYSAFGVQ
jgi:peptide/nickel transport system substrate-binding protein